MYIYIYIYISQALANSHESWYWTLVAKNLLPFFDEFESLSSFCRHFVLGTFLGLIPASVVAVKAGRILSQINSMADLYDHKTILTISVIAILVLLPVILKRQIEQQPDPILTKTT
jgi:integral membrane sensor domain MASE1